MLRTSRLIRSKSLDVRINNIRFNSTDLERVKSYVSSAHPTSHIYLVKHAIPEDESPAEKRYRMMREEYQLWNHFYWEENNKQFQEVSSFISMMTTRFGQHTLPSYCRKKLNISSNKG